MRSIFKRTKAFPVFSFAIVFSFVFLSTAVSDSELNIDGDQYPDLCRQNPIVVEVKEYEDYRIKLSSAGDQMCHMIDIEKQDELVYHAEEMGGYFYFGADGQKEDEIGPFSDVTGEGDIELLVSKWTGGMHCCYSVDVFKLGAEFRKIATIDGGNYGPFFEDVDDDGIPEIRVADDFSAYLFSSFADSPTGDVILKHSNGGYRVAAEYMKKPPPNLNSIPMKIETWQKELRERGESDELPQSLLQTITDLVFTGNKQDAVGLVDRVWPSDVPGKEDFIGAYEEALKGSQFYSAFERQL